MTDDTEELEWPDRMYLLHPSVKTFGDMITTPERKEYVRADRIEAVEARLAKAVEALREIGGEASVPVHTWRNGINFKKLYEGWRKIATQRIDIARAVLAEIEGGKDE